MNARDFASICHRAFYRDTPVPVCRRIAQAFADRFFALASPKPVDPWLEEEKEIVADLLARPDSDMDYAVCEISSFLEGLEYTAQDHWATVEWEAATVQACFVEEKAVMPAWFCNDKGEVP